MEKVYNEEWMKDILGRSKEAMDDSSGSLPEIDWVQYKKGFKKSITFKLMPANMKENNVFSAIVATHWIQMPDGKTKRFICPEETVHLKGQHVKCPVKSCSKNTCLASLSQRITYFFAEPFFPHKAPINTLKN